MKQYHNHLLAQLTALLITLCIAFLLSVLLALVVMWIWNSTFPELFGFQEISAWTAWKIFVFFTILVKSGSLTVQKSHN